MLITSDEQVSAVLRRRVDRVTTRRTVMAMLDGSGLAIESLKYELVITDPHDRRRGRIYIEYGTGHVTWDGVTQEHWGILQGFEYDDGGPGPFVSAEKILNALGADTSAHDKTPACTGTACVAPSRVSCAETASGLEPGRNGRPDPDTQRVAVNGAAR